MYPEIPHTHFLGLSRSLTPETLQSGVRKPVAHRKVVQFSFFSYPLLQILIAEDNVVNQKIVVAFLKKLNFESDVASNGQIAVEYALNNSYDLILMDCQMVIFLYFS
jgi:PleD family two-component response regulator